VGCVMKISEVKEHLLLQSQKRQGSYQPFKTRIKDPKLQIQTNELQHLHPIDILQAKGLFRENFSLECQIILSTTFNLLRP